MRQNVNDKRAKDAYDFIEKVSKKGDEGKDANKKFRTLARSFPTMVQNNGLNVAVAFLLSKSGKEDAHRKFYEKLGKWLKKASLMDALVEMERDEYRFTSQEVMAYTQWVKRFAEGRWAKDGAEKI